MRKAIDGLVEEGLLVRRQGPALSSPTRVEKNFSKLTSFSEDMRRARPHAAQRVAEARRGHGDARGSADAAARARAAPVYRFHRIRYADDAPMALEYATVPAICLPSLEAVEIALRGAGAPATGRCARCSACARCCSPPSRPSYSACEAATPGLLVERRRLTCEDGRAVEFSQSYYRGDTYDFVAELSIAPA